MAERGLGDSTKPVIAFFWLQNGTDILLGIDTSKYQYTFAEARDKDFVTINHNTSFGHNGNLTKTSWDFVARNDIWVDNSLYVAYKLRTKSFVIALDSIGNASSKIMNANNNFLVVNCGATNDTVFITPVEKGIEYTVKLLTTGGGNVVVKCVNGYPIDDAVVQTWNTPYMSRTFIYSNYIWYIK